METRIPDIKEVSRALGYEPEETGFKDLGGGFASYRTEEARDLHKVNISKEWSIATVRELVRLRIKALDNALSLNGIT